MQRDRRDLAQNQESSLTSSDGPADRAGWSGQRGKLRLSTEALYCAAFYGIYWYVRNRQGSSRGSINQAFTNAKRVIRTEQLAGLFQERRIQHAMLGSRLFFQILNTFYGSAHFVVTIGALVWCFLRRQDRYRAVRNTLAVMTALALFGFAFFPLMPPRLLPTSYGFVDSLKVFGGPWSFDSGPAARVSNQYAAMPSLHFGWSSWCAYTLWPWAGTRGSQAKRALAKASLVAYPALTLFTIVVTANHYFLDAAGGALVFGLGILGGRWLERAAVIDRLRMRA